MVVITKVVVVMTKVVVVMTLGVESKGFTSFWPNRQRHSIHDMHSRYPFKKVTRVEKGEKYAYSIPSREGYSNRNG